MGHYKGRDQLKTRRNAEKREKLRLLRKQLTWAGAIIPAEPRRQCHRCKLDILPTQPRIEFFRNGKVHRFRCYRCHIVLDLQEYKKSGLLTMQLALEAQHASFYFGGDDDVKARWKKPYISERDAASINADQERIHAAVKRFERERWYNGGVQEAINAASTSVINGETPTLQVRTFTCAGSTLITMERRSDGSSITVITSPDEAIGSRVECGGRPDEGPMGIQGFGCSADAAVEILDSAVAGWPEALLPGTAIYAGVPVGG